MACGLVLVVAFLCLAAFLCVVMLTFDERRRPSVPSYLKRRPTTVNTKQAQLALQAHGLALEEDGRCVEVAYDPTSLLPTPYRRCAFWHSEVEYTTNRPDGGGFIFHPHAKLDFDPTQPHTVMPGETVPGYPNECIKHITGPWWVFMPEGHPDGKICAAGFSFVEAP